MTNDNDKTQIFNYGKPPKKQDDDHTKINPIDKTSFVGNESLKQDNDSTIIHGAGLNTVKRKLVGWLVSFTLDESGRDFRLFEGKNKLGRDLSNDIRISQDGKISGDHATILFRGDSFYVKDEMATNPSYHNDIEIKPGQAVEVKDGDRLKFGSNTFILRQAWI
jgi:hypothetical protein